MCSPRGDDPVRLPSGCCRRGTGRRGWCAVASSSAKAARSAAEANRTSPSRVKVASRLPALVAPATSSPTSRTVCAATAISQRVDSRSGDRDGSGRPARGSPERVCILRDALPARRAGTLDESNSPSTQGHPRFTARSTRPLHRWIRAWPSHTARPRAPAVGEADCPS